jgi:hypothetical protein
MRDQNMPYDYLLESEEQGLEKLESFLRSRRHWLGERLRWVVLERSEAGAAWNEPGAQWEVVKRLLA